MPVSVDDELDTDPELRVELPCVATPKATLPQVGKQGDTVCHVTLHIERQRTAVDEGVPVVQRGVSFCCQRNFNSFLAKSDASHQIYDRIKCYSK